MQADPRGAGHSLNALIDATLKMMNLVAKKAGKAAAADPARPGRPGPMRPPSQNGPPSAAGVKAALDYAQQVADRGVAERKPAFFGPRGGVAQALDQARRLLAEFAAAQGAGDPTVAELQAHLSAKERAFDALLAELERSTLQNQECPTDKYGGADREALRSRIAAAWKEKYPQDKVLAIRFHMANWDRTSKKTWNAAQKSFEASDKAVLAVSVIVKTDDRTATTYPAYFNKDYLAGGAVTLGVDTKGSAYVHRKILLEKVK